MIWNGTKFHNVCLSNEANLEFILENESREIPAGRKVNKRIVPSHDQ